MRIKALELSIRRRNDSSSLKPHQGLPNHSNKQLKKSFVMMKSSGLSSKDITVASPFVHQNHHQHQSVAFDKSATLKGPLTKLNSGEDD